MKTDILTYRLDLLKAIPFNGYTTATIISICVDILIIGESVSNINPDDIKIHIQDNRVVVSSDCKNIHYIVLPYSVDVYLSADSGVCEKIIVDRWIEELLEQNDNSIIPRNVIFGYDAGGQYDTKYI